MKRTITIIFLVLIGLAFVGSLYYLYQKNNEPAQTFETLTAEKRTIVKKTVATGNINPKEEIQIKPNISGIVNKIFVDEGDLVKNNQLIAQLRVVPNVANLASARNQIESANIREQNQKKIYDRNKKLFDQGVISANEFDNIQAEYDQAKQNSISAKQNFEIIKTGTTKGVGTTANTNIRATITGMVLTVPVKEGNQVIQANNFNEGTTITTLADVDNMIFEGKVDESEVGKVKEGLPLEITVGAIEGKKFDAKLDYIAPKGVKQNGAIQFDIEASIKNPDSTFIRAGLSANASIILEKVEDVLSLKEALVQFDDKDQAYVEVKTGDKEFERRNLELGVSDGIYVEIKEGIDKEDKIKIWNPTKQPEKEKRGS
jgi:HlyD family secretion protein